MHRVTQTDINALFSVTLFQVGVVSPFTWLAADQYMKNIVYLSLYWCIPISVPENRLTTSKMVCISIFTQWTYVPSLLIGQYNMHFSYAWTVMIKCYLIYMPKLTKEVLEYLHCGFVNIYWLPTKRSECIIRLGQNIHISQGFGFEQSVKFIVQVP